MVDTDMQALRPALGMSPRVRQELIGQRLRRDVRAGQPVREQDLNDRPDDPESAD